MRQVVIIGAGVGGLTAAIRLAQEGFSVTVVEARDRPGGLAASFEIDGFSFDAGPYILLDRLGLEWAFRQLGMVIEQLSLQRISEIYETDVEGQSLQIVDSLDETVTRIESRWPGNGVRYRNFIAEMQARYVRLQPLQCLARPGFLDLLRTGAWRDIPFLFRSLESLMIQSRLPSSVAAAVAIWTHVAGQTMATAPSPLALVPPSSTVLEPTIPEKESARSPNNFLPRHNN